LKIKIEKPTISVLLTTICTLKCKHCQIKIPEQKQEHFNAAVIKESIRKMFEVVDFVGDLALMGGELFLHPQIDDIIGCVAEYESYYNRLVPVTNSTVLPGESTVEALKHIPRVLLRLDDYGSLSVKLTELKELFTSEKIPFEVRAYNGDNSYGTNGGGWVDVTGNFEYKGYSETELARVFNTCHNKETCVFLWNGTLFSCGMHAAACSLGKVDDRPNIDSVDLLGNDSNAIQRKAIATFGKIPPNACAYCNGFDIDKSERIRPAIQI
jgi:hypothetical protein